MDEEMVEFSNFPTSWKIILEPVTGNIIMLGVDALMYIVLSKAEKHSFTTACIRL